MLKFCSHNNIDFNKWNQSINNSLDADIFHTYWFLNIGADNKWDAIISDNYDILIPLPYKLNFRRKLFYNPDLIPYIGPIYSKLILTNNGHIFREFINLLRINKIKVNSSTL